MALGRGGGGADLETGRYSGTTGHGRRWTPSCRQTPPRRPWIFSRDSWYLPRTSGLAPPRRCSTPTCRGRGRAGRVPAPPLRVLGVGSGPGLGRRGPPDRSPRLASRRFHCPAREWTMGSAVRIPVLEGAQLSAPEYRSRVYQVLRRATCPRPRSPSRPPLASATPEPATPTPRNSERPSPPADDPGAQEQQPRPEREGPGGHVPGGGAQWAPAPGAPDAPQSRPPAAPRLFVAEVRTQTSEPPGSPVRPRCVILHGVAPDPSVWGHQGSATAD